MDQNALEGMLFHDDFQGKRVARIRFGLSAIRIDTDERSYEFRPSEFDVVKGGANGILIFFNHKTQTGISFCINPGDDWPQHVARLPEGLQGNLRQIARNSQKRLMTSFAIALLLLALIGYGIYEFGPRAMDLVADAVPTKIEEKIGEVALVSLLKDPDRFRNTPAHQQLETLLQPVRAGLPAEYRNLRIYIQKSGELNAFALPGGHIVFHTELLERARSAEEILGVAAHEMAHVTQRHGVKSLLRSVGIYLALSFLLGDVSGLIGVAAENSSFLINQSFSRATEREADKIAFDLLWQQGIDPRGIGGFFQLVAEEEERRLKDHPNIKKALSYFSTHPDTADRIRFIDELWAERSAKQGAAQIRAISFDMKGLRAAVQSL